MTDSILVLATGGTIASTGEEGAVPDRHGSELVAEVPVLADRIRVEQLTQRASPDMDFETLDRLHDRVDTHAGDADTGVVVTHGTDTMAESAYYLDLRRDRGPPVVFTGAQRRPDQPGADGPANLVDAVAVAEDDRARSAGGVYLCLNGELHAARRVVKAHAWRPDAFASPDAGPVGAVGPTGVEWYREPGSRTVTLTPEEQPTSEVPIITTGLGVDRRPVDRAVDAGCDGIVIRATGLGNTPESVADAVGDAVDSGVTVVLTSRCHAGGVAPVYGGGGGHTLRERGALFAGDLSASKARIKLLVAFEIDCQVSEVFER